MNNGGQNERRTTADKNACPACLSNKTNTLTADTSNAGQNKMSAVISNNNSMLTADKNVSLRDRVERVRRSPCPWTDGAVERKERPMPYMEKMLNLLETGKLERGKTYEAVVSHDNDCSFLSGGQCDCDPDVDVRLINLEEMEIEI